MPTFSPSCPQSAPPEGVGKGGAALWKFLEVSKYHAVGRWHWVLAHNVTLGLWMFLHLTAKSATEAKETRLVCVLQAGPRRVLRQEEQSSEIDALWQ